MKSNMMSNDDSAFTIAGVCVCLEYTYNQTYNNINWYDFKCTLMLRLTESNNNNSIAYTKLE